MHFLRCYDWELDFQNDFYNFLTRDFATEMADAFRLLDKSTYLPSWKLIQKLKSEIAPQDNPTLKKAVDNVHKIYATHLSRCV